MALAPTEQELAASCLSLLAQPALWPQPARAALDNSEEHAMNTRFPPAWLARALATCARAATTAGAHAAFIDDWQSAASACVPQTSTQVQRTW